MIGMRQLRMEVITMPDNTCIACGAIIPEGRHICLNCEHGNDMQTFRPRILTNGDRIRNMTDRELAEFCTRLMCGIDKLRGLPQPLVKIYIGEIHGWLVRDAQKWLDNPLSIESEVGNG